MRKWNTLIDITLLDRVIQDLLNSKRLQPGAELAGDPVDLQGLTFPTVAQCEEIHVPGIVATRVIGQKKIFYDAVVRRVDFSHAQLDFSVWNDSRFEQVIFDSATLCQVRFYGCQFVDCSFRFTRLHDATFSVGRNGRETEILRTRFEKCNFGGASSENIVWQDVVFKHCKLQGFVFEASQCDRVSFIGKYKELEFRGTRGEVVRNRPTLSLADANLSWLHANHGIDLSHVILPRDGSCIVILDRLRAVEVIAERLTEMYGERVANLARIFRGIFSNRGQSPLSQDQTMVFVSKRMLGEIGDDLPPEFVATIFDEIKSIAKSMGFLNNNPAEFAAE